MVLARSLIFVTFGAGPATAWAQATEIYKCVDGGGRPLYTSDKRDTAGKKCELVSREVNVVPGSASPRQASRELRHFPRETPAQTATAQGPAARDPREGARHRAAAADQAKQDLAEQEGGAHRRRGELRARARSACSPSRTTSRPTRRTSRRSGASSGNLPLVASRSSRPGPARHGGGGAGRRPRGALRQPGGRKPARHRREEPASASRSSRFSPSGTSSSARLREARGTHWDYSAQNVTYLRGGREPMPLSCMVTRIDASATARCSPSCGRSSSSCARRARSAW